MGIYICRCAFTLQPIARLRTAESSQRVGIVRTRVLSEAVCPVLHASPFRPRGVCGCR